MSGKTKIRNTPITRPQLQAIQAMLSKAGLRGQKDSIVFSYSQGRTTHVSDLYINEAGSLIKWLKEMLNSPDAKTGRMRNKILSIAHELGWELESGRVDMFRINAWCVKYGHAHKELDQYTYMELPRLVTQFENMLKDYLKKF